MTHKKMIKASAAVLLLTAALIGCISGLWTRTAPNVAEAATLTPKAPQDDVRGIWISFHDYKGAGLCDKSEKKFTANADAYFKKLKKDGINTVFFHVVPCNDAIYLSAYLSFSTHMFQEPPDYDPLEILVDLAHSYQMTFHAWVNPYRKTMDVIYDPAKKSSTNRILRIVNEIMENYDVDGIHFDDYFYPSRTKGAQFYSVSVARRKAVINKMVRTVYSAVKDYDETLLFGISPAGNLEYASSLGCDLDTWLSEEGYIDYIVPQIYWSDQYVIGGKVTPLFSDRLDQWISINKNGTPMYIGLGLYRTGARSSTDLGWSKKSNNIVSQIKKSKRRGCEGFVLFSSSYLYTDSAKKEVGNYRTYIRSAD